MLTIISKIKLMKSTNREMPNVLKTIKIIPKYIINGVSGNTSTFDKGAIIENELKNNNEIGAVPIIAAVVAERFDEIISGRFFK